MKPFGLIALQIINIPVIYKQLLIIYYLIYRNYPHHETSKTLLLLLNVPIGNII